MVKFSLKDEAYMHEALLAAANADVWKVSPNPRVGALIVNRGIVVATGNHKKFGGAHAEVEALKDASRRKKSVVGATLYVTLEPCVHEGKKTPPCVRAIISSGIKEVVVAMRDPNPQVAGKGIAALKKAKIKVRLGLMEAECAALNPAFIKWITTGSSYVGMKVAASLDGKIATKTGESKWITSEKARKFVRQLRDSYDAILVGSNTVLADNPMLAGAHSEPIRVILDSTLKTPMNANVLRSSRVIIVTTPKATPKKISEFKKNGVTIKVLGEKIKIAPLLTYLATQHISSVFVEGGSRVFGSFIDSGCVDFVHWFVAPTIIGGSESKIAIGGDGVRTLAKAVTIKNPKIKMIGSDIYIEGKL